MTFRVSKEWLDPETRSLLKESPPGMEKAVGCKGYSLLLLDAGPDTNRIVQVVSDIQQMGADNRTNIAIVIAQQLGLDEALAGQFALSCCDCVSAFVDDNIICEKDAGLVERLSELIANDPEFSPVTIRLISIPQDELGRRFSWQFLGFAVGVATPTEITVYRKKARLMMHWATKCGVRLELRSC